jgi:hypothetical protein
LGDHPSSLDVTARHWSLDIQDQNFRAIPLANWRRHMPNATTIAEVNPLEARRINDAEPR